MQTAEFFVVGGPVQPDRACYIERRADEALLQSIADQQFTYVLSPRASGKSSLTARAVRSLRKEGQLAAVVDLTQIGARGDSDEPGRWYYSIAYRIVRELRLKVDLQSWWQDKSVLPGEQRLVEFFWEVVLTHTTEPIAIFFDEIERTIDLPFGGELFATFTTCLARRVSEPDFTRLNFVVLGVATATQLCADPGLSPFVDGRRIELEDFSLQECYSLAPGLGVDAEVGRGVMERIFQWTHGHPYLCQKIARAVARKGGRLADVERVVQEQFTAAGASQEEPLLNHIRSLLTADSAAVRPALTLLAKIGKQSQAPERSLPAVELLYLAGVARSDEAGRLVYRNRIFEQVFDSRWARATVPIDWRKPLTAVALVLVLVLLPVWYTQILPRPYISTLAVVTQDYAVAEDAYQKLRRLPGFGGTADQLLAEAMARRSRQGQSFAEVMAADAVLGGLPNRGELARELRSEYWLRRAEAAMAEERRDVALLSALQALPSERASGLSGELIGSDYRQLRASFRLAEPPLAWAVDWERDRLVVIDQAHRVVPLPFAGGPADAVGPDTPDSLGMQGRLMALQHVPVTRSIDVNGNGAAGQFELWIEVEHSRSSDLLVTLTAPGGNQAVLALPTTLPERLRLTAQSGAMASLVAEQKLGIWRLDVLDRQTGERGVLRRWGIDFPGDAMAWQDEPEQGVDLPDPVRTDEVEIVLSDNGSVALARSTRASGVGALAVWDLEGGRLVTDLQLSLAPEHVAFGPNPSRAVVTAGQTLTVWDIDRELSITDYVSNTSFVLAPAISVDGSFAIIGEETNFAAPLFRLLRLEDGVFIASVAGTAAALDWVLGPDARYLALLEQNGQVRLLDPRNGRQLGQLRHTDEIRRIIPLHAENVLITVDDAGEIHAWNLALDEAVVPRGPRLGQTPDPASVDVGIGTDVLAFAAPDGRIVVRDLGSRRARQAFGFARGSPSVATRVSPDGARLLSVDGEAIRLWGLDAGGQPAAEESSSEVSVVAVDDAGLVTALGFRGGHVRVRGIDQLVASAEAAETVDFIGHRGGVASLAVNAARNLIASGGDDGVVRIWDLVSVSPSAQFLRHPTGPVQAVAISSDGRWVASAAEYSARVWQVRDGELIGEIPVNGAATALAFSVRGESLAVGDSAGNVFFGAPRGTDPWRSVRMASGVRALDFSADSRWLIAGDSMGRVQLWDAEAALASGDAVPFAHAVNWLRFSADGQSALVRSGPWIHRLKLDDLSVAATRFIGAMLDGDAVVLGPSASSLRLVGGFSSGSTRASDVDLERPALRPLSSQDLDRDWQAMLGLELDPATGSIRNLP